MVFEYQANCSNVPRSSSSSCIECINEVRSGFSHCQQCIINSAINEHTYEVLKRICRKIMRDFHRQQCREKYTVFGGGNSINDRRGLHRSSPINAPAQLHGGGKSRRRTLDDAYEGNYEGKSKVGPKDSKRTKKESVDENQDEKAKRISKKLKRKSKSLGENEPDAKRKVGERSVDNKQSEKNDQNESKGKTKENQSKGRARENQVVADSENAQKQLKEKTKTNKKSRDSEQDQNQPKGADKSKRGVSDTETEPDQPKGKAKTTQKAKDSEQDQNQAKGADKSKRGETNQKPKDSEGDQSQSRGVGKPNRGVSDSANQQNQTKGRTGSNQRPNDSGRDQSQSKEKNKSNQGRTDSENAPKERNEKNESNKRVADSNVKDKAKQRADDRDADQNKRPERGGTTDKTNQGKGKSKGDDDDGIPKAGNKSKGKAIDGRADSNVLPIITDLRQKVRAGEKVEPDKKLRKSRKSLIGRDKASISRSSPRDSDLMVQKKRKSAKDLLIAQQKSAKDRKRTSRNVGQISGRSVSLVHTKEIRGLRPVKLSRMDAARPCDFLRANMEERDISRICTPRTNICPTDPCVCPPRNACSEVIRPCCPQPMTYMCNDFCNAFDN